jgi:hypothetical protein
LALEALRDFIDKFSVFVVAKSGDDFTDVLDFVVGHAAVGHYRCLQQCYQRKSLVTAKIR